MWGRGRSRLVRAHDSETLHASASIKQANALQPTRTSRKHRTERDPLFGNHIRAQPSRAHPVDRLIDVGELGVHDEDRATVGQKFRSPTAQRVKHLTSIGSGVPRWWGPAAAGMGPSPAPSSNGT